ncbi:hypothetical protein [Haloarcula nitratireducens]|uniref:Ribbon-helix-helix protein n=1 Tax=Haloarcula nitratireducens TaxID=2487749 RepID=A0AAW4PEZ0_9EURY|nr:hypothetical protein [Halomicroarcula nitratireducens]MBX0296931.1 hypothetical protein [Halomicroarcula nitratireducens]
MSENVTFYAPDEQKELIERMAERQGMSLSKYCVVALDKQIARDVRSERISETGLEEQLSDMEATVLDEIESALSPSTEKEVLHGVALWNLIGGEYPGEKQAAALSEASDRLDTGLEKLQRQEADD